MPPVRRLATPPGFVRRCRRAGTPRSLLDCPGRCISHPAGYQPPTSPREPKAKQSPANGGPSGRSVERKLADAQISFGHLVVREFPRSFHGYDRAAVRRHLENITTWLSLSGLDDLVRERFNEQDPLGRQLRIQAETEADQIRAAARREAEHHRELGAQAERDAEQVRADARREADEIRASANRDADRLLADGRARAAAERRGPLARFLGRGIPHR